MTLEDAVRKNPFDNEKGDETAYCRYLRYNVNGFYELENKEVRNRWHKVRKEGDNG